MGGGGGGGTMEHLKVPAEPADGWNLDAKSCDGVSGKENMTHMLKIHRAKGRSPTMSNFSRGKYGEGVGGGANAV